MNLILYIMLGVFAVFAIVAVFFIIKSYSSVKSKSEIHISGGANIERGYLSDDNNYFKGSYSGLDETTVIGHNYKQQSVNSASVQLISLKDMTANTLNLSSPVTIGRIAKDGHMEIKGDTSISKIHCRIYALRGDIFIEDLGSTNHTCVNTKRITAPQKLRDNDIIKIGNSAFKVKI